MNNPRIGLICCTHSLWRMLPAFLAYYRALDVSRFFIFADRCAPEALEFLEGQRDVEVISCNRAELGIQNPEFQMRCANAALARCREQGIDWLLHIDPDEFVWLGERRSLPDVARETPAEIEQISFVTRETLPTPVTEPWRFWEQTFVWIGAPPPRMLLDPNTGKQRILDRTLGHTQGKSMGRVCADVQAGTSHVWTRRTGERLPPLVPIPTKTGGEHIHYVLFSAEQFLEKFRAFSREGNAPWPRGEPRPFPKGAWSRWATSATLADVEAYLRDWVWMDHDRVRASVRAGRAAPFPYVQARLASLGFDALDIHAAAAGRTPAFHQLRETWSRKNSTAG